MKVHLFVFLIFGCSGKTGIESCKSAKLINQSVIRVCAEIIQYITFVVVNKSKF